MERSQRAAKSKIALRLAVCAGLAFALAGCAWMKAKPPADEPNTVRAPALVASKAELKRWPNLALFDMPAAHFRYTSEQSLQIDKYAVWHITFPSPFNSPYPANNIVHAEYYRPAGKGPFPAVIVLHHLSDDFTATRIICGALAFNGIAALMVEMAYFGDRRPPDSAGRPMGYKNLDRPLAEALRQTVMDVRRARQLLETFPEVDRGRIGIAGLSLGAIVGSLAAGVDGKFDKCVFILGGGNLADIIWQSPETKFMKDRYEAKGETLEQLRRELKPVEPTEYAGRVEPGRVLMLNATGDETISDASTIALWAAFGKPKIEWYSGSHVLATMHIYSMIRRAVEFIKE